MSILDLAKADIKKITSDLNGFAVSMTFIAMDYDDTTATINGLHTKHHIGINPETGAIINSLNAHISFTEALLTELGYPVRNDNGEVAMRNHKVIVKDSTGIEKTYLIRENFPDETLGFIVLMLEAFEE